MFPVKNYDPWWGSKFQGLELIFSGLGDTVGNILFDIFWRLKFSGSIGRIVTEFDAIKGRPFPARHDRLNIFGKEDMKK